jgi:hypothetical protein
VVCGAQLRQGIRIPSFSQVKEARPTPKDLGLVPQHMILAWHLVGMNGPPNGRSMVAKQRLVPTITAVCFIRHHYTEVCVNRQGAKVEEFVVQ